MKQSLSSKVEAAPSSIVQEVPSSHNLETPSSYVDPSFVNEENNGAAPSYSK